MARLQSGDTAWLVILVGVLIYEFTADDLLSDATERYWKRHPWLTRTVIGAVAGHLAGVIPHHVDVLNAKNVVHKAIIPRLPFARPHRVYTRGGR